LASKIVTQPVIEIAPEQASLPKLVIAIGRGNTGKSAFFRWVVERDHLAGREVMIADADRTNATLPQFFAGVQRPEFSDDDYMSDWLGSLIEAQVQSRMSVVVDMGGGDLVWSRFARMLELTVLLENNGILPVCVHMLGPSLDDLAPMRENRATQSFCPRSTVIVLNEGLIKDTRSPELAFRPLRDDSTFKDELAADAVPVIMPRLSAMHAIDARRVTFATAETTLGITQGAIIRIWRRRMELAFAPVLDWLP